MKMIRVVLPYLFAALLCGCLSQSDPAPIHVFQPQLSPPSAETIPGTRPLRLDRIESSAHLGTHMIWRVSSTELAADEVNLWAEEPAAILEPHLRDLLFGTGGFRESLRTGDPRLLVRLVAFEGDLEGLARVELILDLSTPDAVGFRRRIVEEEPLPSKDAEGLAAAIGAALGRAAVRTAAWVEQNV